MTLPDVKQLKELLKLLRSQGVLQYASVDLTLTLSEQLPSPAPSRRKLDREDLEEPFGEDEDPASEIERLIDYSSRPPSEDI